MKTAGCLFRGSWSSRLFALTTKGAMRPMGRTTRREMLSSLARNRAACLNQFWGISVNAIRLPMMPGCRSLNLSNSVAVLAYEVWRQSGFTGGGEGKNYYR